MRTSEFIGEISPSLIKAQKAITFALMDKVNPHLKSKYADLPSVIDAIKVALNDAGIMFMQTPELMQEMHLQLTTRLIHSSGEWIESTMMMPIVKQDPQGYGSALTYARRYSLAAITGLYQDDDDGFAASKTKKKLTISATDNAFEKLDSKKQFELLGVVEEIESHIFNQDEEAAFKLAQSITDPDEKVALWSKLDSKVRSSIKKTGELKKKAA